MRITPTKIELLDVKHPGLLADVTLWLKANVAGAIKLDDIPKKIAEKYGETVTSQVVSRHKQARYLREKKLLQAAKRKTEAIEELYLEGKITDTRRAQLFEIVDENLREMGATNPKFAATLELGWAQQSLREKQQSLREKQLEQNNRKLELQVEQMHRAKGEVKRAVTEAAGGAVKDKDELLRHIDEIYGVYEAPHPSALPGPMGGGSRAPDDRPVEPADR